MHWSVLKGLQQKKKIAEIKALIFHSVKWKCKKQES